MLRLSASHDNQARSFNIPEVATELGSSPGTGLHLPLPGVSRRHARIEAFAGGVRLTDLGSKNGLRQGGRRLPEVVLKAGESVLLGRVRLQLVSVDTSDAQLAIALKPALPASAPADAETGSPTPYDQTPGGVEALRLIRTIEAEGFDLSTQRGRQRFEESARVPNATSLFVTSEVAGAFAAGHLAGFAPTEDAAARARDLLASTKVQDGSVRSEGTAQERVLLKTIGDARRSALVVVFDRDAGPPQAWQCDLFSYLADSLDPRPTRRTAMAQASGSKGRPRGLILPSDCVRGESPVMLQLFEQLERVVDSALDVVIRGETGTGKEFIARAIHASGPAAKGPFVAINCAAIPAELLEAELFGIKARVATGVDARPGLLVRAHGGCVFFDEIGDMAEPLQAKLLRALQERQVMPVGGHEPESINVRVVSSTHRDLKTLVHAQKFRADLYYRLRGVELVVPPLRERREDIAILALRFAERAASLYGKNVTGISRRALRLLESHSWPGNVRELRSEIERAVLLCPDGAALSGSSFEAMAEPGDKGNAPATEPPPAASRVAPRAEPKTLAERVDEVERQAIVEALRAARGNQSQAARVLGITRNGLAMKMKRLGVSANE